MLTFTKLREADSRTFTQQIYRDCVDLPSHEAASQRITESLYHEFLSEGVPELALVRIFRLCHVNELPDDLRSLVGEDERYVMVLTGTYGQLDSWCNRTQSANHKVISINEVFTSSRIPMFKEILINGMHLDYEELYASGNIIASTQGLSGIFYVPDVTQSSEHIPAQEEFVKPYGIVSEVGFGGIIAGGDGLSLYTLFAFSRVPITEFAADVFYSMRPDIGTALAHKSGQTIFA